MNAPSPFQHTGLSRRTAIQVGGIGLLGLGANHVAGLRALAAENGVEPPSKPKGVIYVFLSGGLAQQDSFDPKPDAPVEVRGEFSPIATRTPGVQVCEHLPMLAARSEQWALVRSLTHPYNEHSEGHMVMLSGRTPLPPRFDLNKPKPSDWPGIASVVTKTLPPRNNLPPAAVLPEKLVHVSGRTIPGQFAGVMGPRFDPWFIEASHYRDSKKLKGALPDFAFEHPKGATTPTDFRYEAPRLELAHGVLDDRLRSRERLLAAIEQQRRDLDRTASGRAFDRHRENAISMLLDGSVHRALDVHDADEATRDRYGRNSFGWSLLMARRLVEAGVGLVQVNLGNDETWDTHEAAFGNLKNFLLPPTDRALAALLDDLAERGLLEDVLVVVAGEFGRTPRIFTIPNAKSGLPGRDHWGAAQTVLLAGGGVRGGTVIGSTDAIGGHPASDPWKPENLAATIYESLGLPREIVWRDALDRPHHVYHGDPIAGLKT